MLKNSSYAQAYLAAIVTSSDDAIISKDLKGNITSWNPAAERIFGYSEAEALGKHITMLIPPDRLSEEEKIIATLKSGNPIDHFETIRRHKDGHLIPISLTISPIRNRKGEIIGASKVSRDISQRMQAETAIKEMNIKKDEFLANMSHELRTPMNAVIGLTSLLQSFSLPDKARKLVETLKISSDNMMDLINDLLDYAKIEAEAIKLEEKKFDLSEQVQTVISIMNVKAHQKGLALNVDFAEGLNRYYLGDSLRVHQIISNLVANAIKFTDSGKIEVLVKGTPNQDENTTKLIISVRDTGIGIPKEKHDLIFEKFTQADSSMTRRFGGSGLGLAITKSLAEKMNGDIKVESDVGIGSIFTVTLNLKNSKDSTSVEVIPLNPETSLPPEKNILLVEDYEPNVYVTSIMLEQLGYDYDVADNGVDAIKKFKTGKYDVILMDIQMPCMDGLEATKRIREIESEHSLTPTPIIALTAHVREQDEEQCIQSGMNDFIPKPFNPIELKGKVEHYLTRRPSNVTLCDLV